MDKQKFERLEEDKMDWTAEFLEVKEPAVTLSWMSTKLYLGGPAWLPRFVRRLWPRQRKRASMAFVPDEFDLTLNLLGGEIHASFSLDSWKENHYEDIVVRGMGDGGDS